jgi:rhodanese-related sulfurtransferase
MPVSIDLERCKRLIAEGAQVVETLPATAYCKLHLAGAVNVSTAELNRETTAGLDRDRPIVVYCYDTQ